MPVKQTAFRLPDETLGQLDEIAKTLPPTPRKASTAGGNRTGGMPATRTDALILAVQKLYVQMTTNTTHCFNCGKTVPTGTPCDCD